ncbi:MAG: MerR family transcriptional regulator [Deltaproteobacteria bacterium]|nr:MerR family transcriptional regulator [Deltaproteobacteria bacterium]
MTRPAIPDKFYFKIGEVSEILGVEPYVVRFWESEFRLTPSKNRSKHRVYNRQELDTLIEIKRLLYEERFTIEGARRKLKDALKRKTKQLDLGLEEKKRGALLQRVKKDLVKIREILKN